MTTTFDRDEATTAPGGDPFLTAKFPPPALPVPLVERPRLLELLTAGAAGPLTLVSAPAGAGKTVLVAEWAASGSAPGPVAWISLESADDESDAFWPYVVMA